MQTIDCLVCVTTSIDDVALAVDRLARQCVSDVGVWMSSSRLRLNSSKTQAIWLGHKNQIDRVNINGVPVLSSSVSTADSVRDLLTLETLPRCWVFTARRYASTVCCRRCVASKRLNVTW